MSLICSVCRADVTKSAALVGDKAYCLDHKPRAVVEGPDGAYFSDEPEANRVARLSALMMDVEGKGFRLVRPGEWRRG